MVVGVVVCFVVVVVVAIAFVVGGRGIKGRVGGGRDVVVLWNRTKSSADRREKGFLGEGVNPNPIQRGWA